MGMDERASSLICRGYLQPLFPTKTFILYPR